MRRRKWFSRFLAVAALLLVGFEVEPARAWKALKPITGPDQKIASWQEVVVPSNRVPLGVNEVPDAIGIFGYPDEKMGLNITPEQAQVNTTGWSGRDYLRFQTSYLGAETKPLQDFVAEFQMDLIEPGGRVRAGRVCQFRRPYYGQDHIRYKSLTYFLAPPILKGMSILVVKPSDETQADDQWVYLPEFRKVRQVSPAQKMDCSGGGDITNDQIDRAAGMWEAKITGEFDLSIDQAPLKGCFGADQHRALLEGRHCVVVEMTPKDPRWPVGKEVVYFEKSGGFWLYEETYDQSGKLVRVLLPFLAHLNPRQPIYWIPGDWYAQDLRTNHKTLMRLAETDQAGHQVIDYKTRDWSNYIFWFDTGYAEDYLSKSFMMRGTR